MAESWQQVAPLETEDPAPRRRRQVDVVALVAGLVFVVLAVALMTGASVPWALANIGFLWVLLIGAGIALLVSELRKAQRRR